MPSRVGSKRAFRYLDGRGKPIQDPAVLERIEELAIPPAWSDVWIAARPGAKLQATGYDKAGRKQYLYHPDYRAAQEQAKYDRLIRFGEHLPELRAAILGISTRTSSIASAFPPSRCASSRSAGSASAPSGLRAKERTA
jgi:DNA topoisomerase I